MKITVSGNKRAKRNEEVARAKRDKLLSTSDWAVLPDAPTDKDAWRLYRQRLRDVTAQDGWPTAVKWPTPPH